MAPKGIGCTRLLPTTQIQHNTKYRTIYITDTANKAKRTNYRKSQKEKLNMTVHARRNFGALYIQLLHSHSSSSSSKDCTHKSVKHLLWYHSEQLSHCTIYVNHLLVLVIYNCSKLDKHFLLLFACFSFFSLILEMY